MENAVAAMTVPRFSFDEMVLLDSPAGVDPKRVQHLPPSLLAIFFFFKLTL